jgi:hypothetical protein
MRISHTQLESCYQNPREWVTTALPSRRRRRVGFSRVVVQSIYRYHKFGDPQDARAYLLTMIGRYKLKNAGRTRQSLLQLDSYIEWFQQAQITTIDHRFRFSFELDDDFLLGGEVARVDITELGIRGVVIGAASADWEREIRFPLLQRGLAQAYQRREEFVSVAVQNLDGSDLIETAYQPSRIDECERIAQRLISTVRAIVREMET